MNMPVAGMRPSNAPVRNLRFGNRDAFCSAAMTVGHSLDAGF